jgi:uncharacterized protein YqeY
MVRDQIKKMSIDALKARDAETRSLLTGVLSKFTEAEKEAGFAGWDEDKERDVVARYTKVLAAALPEVAGTPLAARYQRELDLLSPFLPQLLDEAATRAIVTPLLDGCKGLGMLMGRVLKDWKGKVDPAVVRKIAEEAGLK